MGGRKPTVSDYEIIEFIESASQPFVLTKDVAEHLEFSIQGTSQRLQRLETEGLLDAREIGSAKAYWLTDTGEALLEGDLVEDDVDVIGEDDLEQRNKPD